MADEQMDLIDVKPEHSTEIVACVKRYKHAQTLKKRGAEEEKNETQNLLDLIEAEDLECLEDGTIVFTVDGYKISVVPQDSKVKVKGEGEEE